MSTTLATLTTHREREREREREKEITYEHRTTKKERKDSETHSIQNVEGFGGKRRVWRKGEMSHASDVAQAVTSRDISTIYIH